MLMDKDAHYIDENGLNKRVFSAYRGRLAPTPGGYLHRGHAATFFCAWQRCRDVGGTMVLRMEDLDLQRCLPQYSQAAIDDLRWLGLDWDEGPDRGGPHAPYLQSGRISGYLDAWQRLRDLGWIYPCLRSRREIREYCGRADAWSRLTAPHEDEESPEPLFPAAWRVSADEARSHATPEGANWRFRVPDGSQIDFIDGHYGQQSYVAGIDFGDFLVWSRDGIPAYELAVVVDDHAMHISEVVRGADLLKSTARQILIYRALGWPPPAFYHCPLVRDAAGRRLAKRTDALALRTLRQQGLQPEDVLK